MTEQADSTKFRPFSPTLITQLKNRNVQLILLVTLLGFVLRILGLNFGLPHDSRPDEIPILNIIFGQIIAPIVNHGNWELNPHFLDYPSLYFYILTAIFAAFYGIGYLLGWFPTTKSFIFGSVLTPTPFHLVLRWFSAISGTIMIVAIAFLAKQWQPSSKRVVFYAALLAATNYLLVRNSHFGSVDILMTLGITLSLWAMLKYRENPTARRLQIACIFCGLSTGVKYPAAILLLPLWIVLLEQSIKEGKIYWKQYVLSAFLATLLVTFVFLLTTPWLLLDFPKFLKDFTYESSYFFKYKEPGLESGWVFYPCFALWHGVGLPVLILTILGLVSSLKDTAKRWQNALMLSFLLGFYILLGFNERVMTRYVLPLLPVIIVYASTGLELITTHLYKRLKVEREAPQQIIAVFLVLLACLPSLWMSFAFDRLLMKEDTRQLAEKAILRNVPPSTLIATGPWLGRLRLPRTYTQWPVAEPTYASDLPPKDIMIQRIDSKTLLINSYGDLEKLRKLGIRYVVIFEGHRFYGNRIWEIGPLTRNARKIYHVSPLKKGVPPQKVGRFDPMDAFYLPYGNFSAFERPGPDISIFDLSQKP